MIIDFVLFIITSLLSVFLALIATIFALVPTTFVVSLGNGFGYVFGNLMLFNSFLPITELLYLSGIALTFKSSFLLFKSVFWLLHVTNVLRRTFMQVSV